MTPPATAAARMRPASYAANRSSHIAPIEAVSVPATPASISPERIRKGSRPLQRPAVRRYSGEAASGQTPQTASVASAAMDFRRDLSAIELPQIRLPRINWSSLRGKRVHLSVPRPAGVVGAVRSAPDHPITKFMTSTRVWVGVLAALIGGLVFMQVQILHVNAGIGENVQKISSLQRQNAELRTAVSGLGSDQRIVAEAQRMGFVEPPVGSSHFTAAHPGDAGRALALLSASATGGGMVATDGGGTQAVSSDGGQTSSSAVDQSVSGAGPMDSSASSGTTSAAAGSGSSGSQGSSSQSSTTTTAAAPDGGSSPLSG